MADDFRMYWFAVDHGRFFYRDVKDVILFDDDNSLERILDEPTIFVANHTSTVDIPHMHYAIQDSLSKHPRDARRMIRTISKDDNFIGIPLIGPLVNHWFNRFARKAGAIMTKPDDSKNLSKKLNPLWPIMRTLSAGSHILVYSMGGVSEDGTIDYKRSDGLPTFNYAHMAVIARILPRTHVQAIHYTIDPVHDKFLMRMGERQLAKDLQGFDFKQEIGKCTTITGLQLLSLYTKIAKENGAAYTTKGLAADLSAFAEELHSRGYNIYDPNATMDDAIAYADSGARRIIDLNYNKVDIADASYQANQLKHLSLEDTAREFIMSRNR